MLIFRSPLSCSGLADMFGFLAPLIVWHVCYPVISVRTLNPKSTWKGAQGPSHYIILQYCACPSPKTFAACQVRPFILLCGEMANHLGWGAPKHTALMTCLYMLVSSKSISFFFRFTWKWDFTTPPHRHMHARYKVYVSRLLLRSYDFQLK